MTFDAARALAEAADFAFDRLPWSEGGRRAVDRVAERFEEAGYAVDRAEVPGSPTARSRGIVLVPLGFSTVLGVVLVLQGSGSGFTARFVCLIAGVAATLLAPYLFGKSALFQGRVIRTWNVSAWRPDEWACPHRVVVLTTLDVAPPVPRSNARAVVRRLYFGAAVVVLLVSLLPLRVPRRAAVALLATFAAVAAALLVCHVRPFPGEGGTDNRDGLGFLVELARSWPHAKAARIEVRFVACGGESLNGAGREALGAEMAERWAEKPTLVLAVWSPGRASTLTIEESGQSALGTANDLWIPARAGRGDVVAEADLFPDGNESSFDAEFIGLIGVPTSDAPDRFDKDAVHRAAQLVHELVLRWSKLHSTQPPGAAASRSSQNLG